MAADEVCSGGKVAGIEFFGRHPELGFAVAVDLQCELNEARELLLRVRGKDYPQHRIPCPVTMIGSSDCYCGLEEWYNDSKAWLSRNK